MDRRAKQDCPVITEDEWISAMRLLPGVLVETWPKESCKTCGELAALAGHRSRTAIRQKILALVRTGEWEMGWTRALKSNGSYQTVRAYRPKAAKSKKR